MKKHPMIFTKMKNITSKINKTYTKKNKYMSNKFNMDTKIRYNSINKIKYC